MPAFELAFLFGENVSAQYTTIFLSGQLGAKYGRRHRVFLDTASVVEAVYSLGMQIEGFTRDLMTSADRGIRYAIFRGKKNIGEDQIADSDSKEIRIVPVLTGSKRSGVLQTVIGAVLVVAGYALSVFTNGASLALVQPGIVLMAGGVIQMLSPQQKGISAKDNPDNGASYNFNGPVNTSAQGNPVPLLYGRMICGSAVISAGILADDKV